MADRRVFAGALALLLVALGLTACGSDTTTTVTETAPAASSSGASGGATVPSGETGSGEAAAEPIAPPDAKAKAQIDKITSGVTSEQKQTDSSGSDTIAGGENGVPKLSFSQAKSNLSRARYCGNYVVAGPNTSCSFALNVAYDFYANGRPRSFISYSPVTGAAYHVYCRGKHPTVCVAGNNAAIYIG